MKTKRERKLGPGMIAVAGVLIVWSGLVWRGGAETRASTERLVERSKALNRSVNEARHEVERAEQTLRELKPAESTREAGRTPEQRMEREIFALIEEVRDRDFGADSNKPRKPEPPSGRMGSVCFPELMTDPEYARLSATYYRYDMEERYAPLFATLALSTDKRDALLGFLVEKKLVEFEGESAVRQRLAADANGQPLDKRKVDAIIKKEIDAEIRTTLGDAVFEAYADFERTYWARAPVEIFATRLRLRGDGLDSKAADALRELLMAGAKTDSRTRRGSSRMEFSNESLERARDLLTPGQWEVLKQIEAEKKAQTELFTRVSRSFLNQSRDVQNLKRLDEAAAKAKPADSTAGAISAPKRGGSRPPRR